MTPLAVELIMIITSSERTAGVNQAVAPSMAPSTAPASKPSRILFIASSLRYSEHEPVERSHRGSLLSFTTAVTHLFTLVPGIDRKQRAHQQIHCYQQDSDLVAIVEA